MYWVIAASVALLLPRREPLEPARSAARASSAAVSTSSSSSDTIEWVAFAASKRYVSNAGQDASARQHLPSPARLRAALGERLHEALLELALEHLIEPGVRDDQEAPRLAVAVLVGGGDLQVQGLAFELAPEAEVRGRAQAVSDALDLMVGEA